MRPGRQPDLIARSSRRLQAFNITYRALECSGFLTFAFTGVCFGLVTFDAGRLDVACFLGSGNRGAFCATGGMTLGSLSTS
jgi:hypothetical protein